jgi:hypothetical protein
MSSNGDHHLFQHSERLDGNAITSGEVRRGSTVGTLLDLVDLLDYVEK